MVRMGERAGAHRMLVYKLGSG